MRERAERTLGLRAHFLPEDPFERRPRGGAVGDAWGRRVVPAAGVATAIAGAAAGTLMGGLGGRREPAHNVTTAADYRTALLSDSP